MRSRVSLWSHEDRFVSDVPNVTVSPRRVAISASMAMGNRSSRMRGHLAAQAGPQKNERVAVSPSTARRPSFRDVFAHPEFRALWVSYVLSAGGDRLALVALTLLVYDRSKSPLLAAITFAAGFVPYLFGGMFLSGLADRLPRRSVMVACDLIRVVLVAAMLAPGVPLAAHDRPALRGHAAPAAVRRVPLRDRPRRDGAGPLPAGHGRHGLDHPRGDRGRARRPAASSWPCSAPGPPSARTPPRSSPRPC